MFSKFVADAFRTAKEALGRGSRNGNEDAVCELPKTIEMLAEDYGLPVLTGLFNQKARDVVVMTFEGLVIPELGIEGGDFDVVFSWLDDIEDGINEKITTGFELSLADRKTGHQSLSLYHGEKEPGSGRFGFQGGQSTSNFDSMNAVMSKGGPDAVLKGLIRQEPVFEGLRVQKVEMK